ncbi:MAG: peptide deformylase [Bacteroidetes bacterium]|nr:peptide deformylase [Bacteroidota bacterium]
MSILPIYLFGNDVLKTPAKKVEKLFQEDLILIKNMFETMKNSNGIGLAANQIGVLKQILVIDISEMEDGKKTKPFVVINPVIKKEIGKWQIEEGCLSIPGIRADVERAEKISLKYLDEKFIVHHKTFSGLMARVLLHEIDHLNGILFIEKISSKKRKEFKNELMEIKVGNIRPNYAIVIAENLKE